MIMFFSMHCLVRSQQRCLPPIVHDWLDAYGEVIYDGHGGMRVYFSHRSRRKMEQELGRHFVRQNGKYLNAYRVESSRDGQVITAGWLSRRIGHP